MVTIRSADAWTVVVAVPPSLPGFGSEVAEEAVAVFESTVPLATVAPTLTVSVKTALPTPRLGVEHDTVPPAPTAGMVQDHPTGDASDTKVVPTGSGSVSDTVAALLGPALATVMVYVRLLPALTGSGVSTFVTDRLADAPTVVVAVPLSFPGFGSEVAEETVAVLESTVPALTLGDTATVSVKTALPTPRLGFELETVPPAPTAGVVEDHPPGDERDTNVVPAGSVSVSDTVAALLGPALVTVMV